MRWLGVWVVWLCLVPPGLSDDLERKPIEYSRGQGENPVAHLQRRLQHEVEHWESVPRYGFLPKLLQELDIPTSSQTLVFSKTSFQRNRISPETPRALYFNDEVYVGFCEGGSLLEISVADPKYGTEFYSLATDGQRPKIQRQTEECLICHGSSATRGMPGHLLRSVYPDRAGQPLLAMGSHRSDPTLSWSKRFGGWYVTGDSSNHFHLGNLALRDEVNPDEIERETAKQSIGFTDQCNPDQYLAQTSDIVAHLVLAHQVHFHNQLAKLSLETQIALHDEELLNRELREPNQRRDSTTRRIRNLASELVKTIFFANDIAIPKLTKDGPFVLDFERRGIRDPMGRSLRDLQLDGRLFRYRCSYLIYTRSFQQMPSVAMEEVLHQMHQVIEGASMDTSLRSIDVDERLEIDAILKSTWDAW